MGITQVQAKILGEYEEREYTFIVDTAATYIRGPAPGGDSSDSVYGPPVATVRLMSATGLVDVETFCCHGRTSRGQKFAGVVVPSSSHLLGYELLQNLRYRVNPVSHDIEKVPDDEMYPPYLL